MTFSIKTLSIMPLGTMILSIMSLGILHSAWHFDIPHGIFIFSILTLYKKHSAC